MPGPDTVAEEAPVFYFLLLGLALALQWVMYRGLRYTWFHTIGWAIGKVAEIGIPTGFFGKVHPFRFLSEVNNAVMNYLGEQALEAEQAMGRAFHQAAYVQEWIVKELYGLGRDLFSWADGLQNHYLRKLIKGLVFGLFPWLAIGRLIHSAISSALPAVRKEIGALEHSIPRRVRSLLRPFIVAAFPLIVALPWMQKEIRTLNRRWEIHKRRLLRLEKLLTTVGFAAAMAASLGLKDWRCITRGNIGRAARAWCGLDKALVDLFLLGTVEAFAVNDLCEFSYLLGNATKAIRPGLMELVSVEDALVGCHGATAPISFDLPPISLPAVVGTSPLAA